MSASKRLGGDAGLLALRIAVLSKHELRFTNRLEDKPVAGGLEQRSPRVPQLLLTLPSVERYHGYS